MLVCRVIHATVLIVMFGFNAWVNCHLDFSKQHFTVVKNNDKFYYLGLNKGLRYQRFIPNWQTVEQLGHNPNHVTPVSDEILSNYQIQDPVPSLILQHNSPDEQTRVLIQTLELLSSPFSAIITDEIMVFDHQNPSIVQWNNRTLSTSRKYVGDAIKIKFNWMGENFTIDEPSSYFGISPSTEVETFDFNILQEDPRLFLLSNGSLAVSYTSKHSIFEIFHQCYFIITINPSTGIAEFEDSVNLDQPERDIRGKNWIMMEHEGVLMFIQSINPLHIVNITGLGADRTAVLNSVVREEFPIPLPWRQNFENEDIRGGTPAILVRGLYLAFFHTVAWHNPYDLRTYFFGAITFCPNHPFNIHSMSPTAIVDYNWYQGEWTFHSTHSVDYVVFPIGIMMDENDENSLWVSVGVQDRHGMVLKFDVDELLKSMVEVAPCLND